MFSPYILIPVGLFYLFTTTIADLSAGSAEYNVAGLIASGIMIVVTFAAHKSGQAVGGALVFWPFISACFVLLLFVG